MIKAQNEKFPIIYTSSPLPLQPYEHGAKGKQIHDTASLVYMGFKKIEVKAKKVSAIRLWIYFCFPPINPEKTLSIKYGKSVQ